MKHRYLFFAILSLLLPLWARPASAGEPLAPERFQHMLKLFPGADANGDGKLSIAEGLEFRQNFPGAQKPSSSPAGRPEPSHADVKYGPHERNVFDLWLAESEPPTPLVVFLHGGGFTGGDKSKANPAAIQTCLDAGVSFMAVNYRFLHHAPIQDILLDTARAVQFIRFHASTYRIDPRRIASFGTSAGAGSSLWLAVRDDLADPGNPDPVLRQSSRILAAGCLNPQASYDLTEWESIAGRVDPGWLRSEDEDLAFYHFTSRDDFDTARGRRVLDECSMLRQISPDDPPLVLANTYADTEPANRGAFLHHPNHVKAVRLRCQEAGVPSEIHLLGNPGQPRGNANLVLVNFLLQRLSVVKAIGE